MADAGQKRPIRVLIIDDSATMRGLMDHALSKDPELEVIGYAADAYGAREAIKTLDPDVVTLDINMPRMDGLTFLEKLMRLRPIPVVVVTSQTEDAEQIEGEALQLGAAHCLFKPAGMTGASLFSALPEKLKDAVAWGADGKSKPSAAGAEDKFESSKMILLGASTGGVDALVAVLRTFPKNCPPTLIVQHMPPKFIELFTHRLNSVCAPSVHIASHGSKPEAGRVLIAPAGQHMRLVDRGSMVCELEDTPPVNGFKPSVDVLFESGVELKGPRIVAALLTGMGRDGAKGLLQVKQAGGFTAAQDEETSVVWGMPRVAFELGAVDVPIPLNEIAPAVLGACRAKTASKAC
ncbi:MAG: chemotaxis response regulator protein-glutamate methylesterase [Pseudomonadota bacterium]